MTLHPEILSEKQKQIIEKLGFLKTFSCYLAGGTSLAIQIGHRTSLDLDFYTNRKFENTELVRVILKELQKTKLMNDQPEGTLQGDIAGVRFSLLYYDYPLVHPLIHFPPIKLASLEDIAAMKIAAIIQRAKQRDFFDIYYLIQKLSMEVIIKSTYQKYPWYEENNQIIFKSLTYFEEADKDEEIKSINIYNRQTNWKKVKDTLSQEVRNYLSRRPIFPFPKSRRVPQENPVVDFVRKGKLNRIRLFS